MCRGEAKEPVLYSPCSDLIALSREMVKPRVAAEALSSHAPSFPISEYVADSELCTNRDAFQALLQRFP